MHDKYKQEGTTYQAIVRQPSPEKEQDIFFFLFFLGLAAHKEQDIFF